MQTMFDTPIIWDLFLALGFSVAVGIQSAIFIVTVLMATSRGHDETSTLSQKH